MLYMITVIQDTAEGSVEIRTDDEMRVVYSARLALAQATSIALEQVALGHHVHLFHDMAWEGRGWTVYDSEDHGGTQQDIRDRLARHYYWHREFFSH